MPELIEQPLKLRPLPTDAGDLLTEDFLAARPYEDLHLQIQVLIEG
jgi:hypothetical protein